MKQAIDFKALAERYTIEDALRVAGKSVELRRHGREQHGACPQCGGTDRFYLLEGERECACRQCHPARMDAIGALAWMSGLTMRQALERLEGCAGAPSHNLHGEPSHNLHRKQERQTDEWRKDAERLVNGACERLLSRRDRVGSMVADYLLSRRLEPATWREFSFGAHLAKQPCSKQPAPAVSWPVLDDERRVCAVRFRFLHAAHDERFSSLYGSRMTGYAFGEHRLTYGRARQWRVLFIMEGEFNAASVHQVLEGAHIDAVSIGAQSARLSPGLLKQAPEYGACVVWCDEPEKALALQSQLPAGALALRSPLDAQGAQMDANALLQGEQLLPVVASAALKALEGRRQALEGFLWCLWDEWRAGSLDASTLAICREHAAQLGFADSWSRETIG